MNDHTETIDRLAQRLEDLERRVDVLEHPLAARWPRPTSEPETTPAPGAPAAAAFSAGGVIAVLGRAMLGIAGAYLLRALAEGSSLPRVAVAWAGIIYAFLWLGWAARARGESQLISTVYACTSALILAPMLWELTLRFRLLPASITAAVLVAFALAAFGLAWKRQQLPALRVAVLTAAGLAVALALASHDLLPFTTGLLALVTVVEFAPWRDRIVEIRLLAALAADAVIWVLIFVYFSPQNAHSDYPLLSHAALIAPGITLFVISAISMAWLTVARGRTITIFETLQTTIAFLLASVCVADFEPTTCLMILGVLCFVLSAACYLALFLLFAHRAEPRNFTVFAAWGAAVLVCGCLLTLPAAWTAACLSAAAVAATLLGRQRGWVSFELYSVFFLLAAAAVSGLFSFLGHALVGIPPGAPATAAWLVAGSALLCYAAARPSAGESWKLQTLHLIFAAGALGATSAFLVQALVSLTALKVIPGAHHLAFIRTFTLCAAALALVFGGAHWRRLELTRLGYATLALVAVKLVAEDLRHGHLAYIAGSIFLFALTLIAAPRLARARQKA